MTVRDYYGSGLFVLKSHCRIFIKVVYELRCELYERGEGRNEGRNLKKCCLPTSQMRSAQD